MSLANAHWQQRIRGDAMGRNARGCLCILLCRDSSRTFSGPCLCPAWGFPWLQAAAGGGAPGVHTDTSTLYSLHLHLLLQGHPLFSVREPVMPRTHPRRNLWNRRLTPVNKWLCIPICISSVGQRMDGKNSQGGWNLISSLSHQFLSILSAEHSLRSGWGFGSTHILPLPRWFTCSLSSEHSSPWQARPGHELKQNPFIRA